MGSSRTIIKAEPVQSAGFSADKRGKARIEEWVPPFASAELPSGRPATQDGPSHPIPARGKNPEVYSIETSDLANNYFQLDARYQLLFNAKGVSLHTGDVLTSTLKQIKKAALRQLWKSSDDFQEILRALETSNLSTCSGGRDGNYADSRHHLIIQQREAAQRIHLQVKQLTEEIRKADF